MVGDIHVALIEDRYAHGWHFLGLAEDFRDVKRPSVKATLRRFSVTTEKILTENYAGW